ncbi:hypothetical protein CH54_3212 [Yersinia rochesterensis]|uniref:Flagellar protein lafD n=1 Tax=Yersinia rochesterensis TaxID=1604335 RepID=A0ABN4FA41_9GAMM|nr:MULTISPECIES: hypothetical protein [Yersinia]AJI85324.1 hypothetical protein AW19_2576 [Yersinia frederiksenii Y225]AIN20393.1 hypothetical protein DJ57_4029 [Yersinia rochesterensis]AJJ34045.1 hypothetical protein CH54_3212 [Yersinia rochesterensis]PEH54872.1 hypothetical protein CRM81_17170 [Yersinia kristensenii]CRY64870.1 putative flagellar protein lafD [Yersinia kristensenii]
MNDLLLINECIATLDLAIGQQDWEQIEAVDSRVIQWLAQRSENSFSLEQQSAMQRLKEMYQRAYECCGLQKHQLKDEIARQRAAQVGITAYATMAISAYEDMAQQEETR